MANGNITMNVKVNGDGVLPSGLCSLPAGCKYHRSVKDLDGKVIGKIDVYSVLDAFNVINPPLQHAIKKLLCAGIRNKGSFEQDCNEAIEAVQQAYRFHKGEEE